MYISQSSMTTDTVRKNCRKNISFLGFLCLMLDGTWQTDRRPSSFYQCFYISRYFSLRSTIYFLLITIDFEMIIWYLWGCKRLEFDPQKEFCWQKILFKRIFHPERRITLITKLKDASSEEPHSLFHQNNQFTTFHRHELNWVETKLVPPLYKIFTLQCAFFVVS